ncbi:putative quinol monooxygenase [Rheinheimera soli]|uniref:Quinol monooxygenase YgiN n=1 Tax=Rheinheimera soli TaxID=443616 RepID=A0ABU1W1M9_9GAMM|nr:putative quinol monooxygenase [Rheinheimera soli]MDR7121871.1 quinol monooxygenase YgiN [Rheinheimera soli]
MTKVYVTAELFVQPHCIEEAKLLLSHLATDSVLEDGCESYEILACTTDLNRLSTWELWSDSQAETAHWQTEHVKTTVEQLQALLQQPAVVKKYSRVQNNVAAILQ